MASPTIELQDVSMAFGSETLFQNLNLQIHHGESFVLVGPSGEGKSVLLKIMAGILEPTGGRVLIDGKDLHQISRQERDEVMRSMGMLFQKNALFDSLTSGENIAFPMRELTDQSEEDIEKVVVDFLERVAIPHAKNLYPDEISGGMQKRLGIARALVLKPKIILYDDPTAGLDPITSRMIIDMIIDLRRENSSTLVAITNDMARAYQLADRIGMLVDGELIETGNVAATKSHQDPRVFQFIRGELSGPLTEGL